MFLRKYSTKSVIFLPFQSTVHIFFTFNAIKKKFFIEQSNKSFTGKLVTYEVRKIYLESGLISKTVINITSKLFFMDRKYICGTQNIFSYPINLGGFELPYQNKTISVKAH